MNEELWTQLNERQERTWQILLRPSFWISCLFLTPFPDRRCWLRRWRQCDRLFFTSWRHQPFKMAAGQSCSFVSKLSSPHFSNAVICYVVNSAAEKMMDFVMNFLIWMLEFKGQKKINKWIVRVCLIQWNPLNAKIRLSRNTTMTHTSYQDHTVISLETPQRNWTKKNHWSLGFLR